MANRFWVGGAGTWDASSTTHWSTSSGGAAGASAPTTADSVFIDASSGAGVITLSWANAASLDCTGSTNTLTGNFLQCYGSVTLASGGTYTGLSLGAIAVMGSGTLTPAGKTIASLLLNATDLTIAGSLTVSGAVSLVTSTTIQIQSGSTLTLGDITGPGSGGNANIRSASAGSTATISDSSGTNQIDRTNLKDLVFSGGATWIAGPGSVNQGNVSGISFLSSGFFPLEIF